MNVGVDIEAEGNLFRDGTLNQIEFREVVKFQFTFFLPNPDMMGNGRLPLVVKDFTYEEQSLKVGLKNINTFSIIQLSLLMLCIYCMKTYQSSFFDESKRLAALSRLGDPLEQLSKYVDFEIFRSVLTEAFQKTDRKSPAGRKSLDVILMSLSGIVVNPSPLGEGKVVRGR